MTAYTLRWLIFTALCALLLLSLPARYGRAENGPADRTESRSFVVQGNEREVHRLVLCTARVEARVFHAVAGVAVVRQYADESNRPIETSCVFPRVPGYSAKPSWVTTSA